VNPYQGNNLCAVNKFDSGNIDLEENFILHKKQICANSFKSGYENVYLEREYYKISLSLTLPDLKENYSLFLFLVTNFFFY